MDLYHLTFALLAITSCGVTWVHYRNDFRKQPYTLKDVASKNVLEDHGDARKFKQTFLPVYLLVMASDWLQGAYVYTLYKDEKNLTETVVANLFTCGFSAAAVSALFVGFLADKYGRRLACLVFCVSYSIGCLTKISNDVSILFIGRLLGGLSTTLMYSAFESWMVTEYFAQGLDRSNMTLHSIFGIMTTLNSIIAVLSGLVGESLVVATGTKVSPFMAAVGCLCLAYWLITKNWAENYGDATELKKHRVPKKSTLRSMFRDEGILLLAFISFCVEGSMYIFVFYWSPAMKYAHARSMSTTDGHDPASIPFGIIFASFMAAMMLGSQAFTYLSAPSASRPSSSKHLAPCTLLTLSAAAAAISLLATILSKDESLSFWAFCFFEACLGIYFPAMAAQRAMIVDDSVRAEIYGMLRIPLNIFVVVALTTTVQGDAHRDLVFLFCGGLLLLASLAASSLRHHD